MSSSRRRLPRRSLSSPRWSMADSLMSCSSGQRTAYGRRALELKPVAGSLQDHELEFGLDVLAGGLHPPPAQRGIVVTPDQRRPHFDGSYVREALPGTSAGSEVGAVVVEGRGEAARA